VLGSAETMPFLDCSFDLSICRQGIQFMDASRATREMVRITRKDGRVVLVNLCAYNDQDRNEYFEILRLRNPARRNFFMLDDLACLCTEAGCRRVDLHSCTIAEDIDLWADNKAISHTSRQRIHHLYRQASPAFSHLHKIECRKDGSILDQMLFGIAVGWR